jgi:hypothetical protein
MYVAEQGGHSAATVSVAGTALDSARNLSTATSRVSSAPRSRPMASASTSTTPTPNGDTNVDEYGCAATRRREHPPARAVRRPALPNHNGGEVVFGPTASSTSGSATAVSAGDPHGQRAEPRVPLGKILRIDPNAGGNASYSIPKDNPFVGAPGASPRTGCTACATRGASRSTGKPEIVWIGDVGQGAYEEIDYAPRGAAGINWGWSQREGNHEFKGAARRRARPDRRDTHDDGWCAIVGGYVYRGRAIPRWPARTSTATTAARTSTASCNGRRVVAARDMGITVDGLTTFGEDAPASSTSRRATARSTSSRGLTLGARALEHRGGEPAADACGAGSRSAQHLVEPPGIAIARFFASASRPTRATSSASCHMNPGTASAGTLAVAGSRCA